MFPHFFNPFLKPRSCTGFLLLVLEDRIKAESAKEIAATQNLEQAARNIGISQTRLKRILDRKEEGKLDIDTLRVVCQTLNIPVEYISQ